jgi:hypothetical protein
LPYFCKKAKVKGKFPKIRHKNAAFPSSEINVVRKFPIDGIKITLVGVTNVASIKQNLLKINYVFRGRTHCVHIAIALRHLLKQFRGSNLWFIFPLNSLEIKAETPQFCTK